MAGVGRIFCVRVGFAGRLLDGALPGIDAVLFAAGHGHSADGGAVRQEQGRGVSRIPAHHERLRAVVPEKSGPKSTGMNFYEPCFMNSDSTLTLKPGLGTNHL